MIGHLKRKKLSPWLEGRADLRNYPQSVPRKPHEESGNTSHLYGLEGPLYSHGSIPPECHHPGQRKRPSGQQVRGEVG